MSIFDGVEEAQVFENGKKMNPGHSYTLRIVRMQERKSGRDNTIIVPVEFEVEETTDPTTNPGDRISWVPKQKHGHAFQSNMLSFVTAALGLDPSDSGCLDQMRQKNPQDQQGRSYARQTLEDACGPNNVLAGYRICARTGHEQQTKAGHNFVPVYFSPAR